MDILNFISWIKGKRQVTSVDPTKTLIPVGLKDPKRDDDYIAGAISVEDLAAQIAPQPTYKVYTALLTQNNSINGGNPVVLNVLENTIGNITWTKLTTGSYIGTLSNAFVENKTFAIAGQANTSEIWFDLNFGLDFTVDTIPLYRTDNSGATIDNWGMPISIEIRVYN